MAASERNNPYLYSKALAAIFLTELGGGTHAILIQQYAEMLARTKKEAEGRICDMKLETQHGDTSQTQYVALCYWELMRIGIRPDAKDVEDCLNWLLKTQDPERRLGLRGDRSNTDEAVHQPTPAPACCRPG